MLSFPFIEAPADAERVERVAREERRRLEARARARLELLRRRGKHDLCAYIQRWQPSYRRPTHMMPLVDALDRSLLPRSDLRSRLILCEAPPRHFKTSVVIAHAARCVGDWHLGVAYCTYAGELAKERSREARELVARSGAWVGELENSPQQFEPSKSVSFWQTNEGGRFVAGGRQGQFIGRGFDFIGYDDGLKNPSEALSIVVCDEAFETYKMLVSRLEPGGTLLVTHQRWGTGDPIGRIKALMMNDDRFADVEVITLRALENLVTETDELGREIIISGEPLCPWRYDLDSLRQIAALQDNWFWPNYQQDDTPRGDRVFGEFDRYLNPTVEHAIRIISCDPGIRKKDANKGRAKKPDPAGIVVGWAYLSKDRQGNPMVGVDVEFAEAVWLEGMALLDRLEAYQVHTYSGAPVVLETVSAFVLLEQVGARLNPKLQIHTWTPNGSKFLRAQPTAKAGKHGLIRVPMAPAAWVNPFVTEVRSFTGADGADDGQVDALTQLYDFACQIFGIQQAGAKSGGEASIMPRNSPW
jgi:hypothetical protein